MVEIKKIEFNGWKDCVLITNGTVEAVITTEIGPRIISYGFKNGANHMAVLEYDKTAKNKFQGYGGHRVWHAPEEPVRTYFPDNEKCECIFEGNSVTVTHREKETSLLKSIVLEMDDNGVLTVNNVISNDNHFDVELSVWGLTQFASGGLMAVPNSKLNTGLVANRAIAMWPYSKMNDKRVYWGDEFITVVADGKTASPFKFGATVDEAYAAYFNHDQLVLKEFEYYFDADYPSYSCNFESYTNESFIEIESLSPLMTVEPGEVAVSIEKWHITDNVKKPAANDETAIKKAVEKLLK